MLLREGDLIRLVNPMPQFHFQERLFRVIGISPDGAITIENPNIGRGIMDYDAFARYFEKHDEDPPAPPKRTWSDWKDGGEFGYDHFLYKENGKRLVVKFIFGGTKASASCHPLDTFDAAKGIKLAVARHRAKAMAREVAAIKASM